MLEQIRCGKEIPDYDKHRHSGITRNLRLSILEDDLYSEANLAYLGAWAGLSSHEKIDIQPAFAELNKLYERSVATRAFMKVNQAGELDTDAIVKEYKQFLESQKNAKRT